MLFAVILYCVPRQVVQISSTSEPMSPEPCKLRYIITCHLAEACKYRQLLHPSRAAFRDPLFSLFWWPAFSLRKYCLFYLSSCHSSPFSAGGVLLEPLSGGLRRPLVPSGGFRRPPAASGGLWRPPGALQRPPAHSSASFCARCSPEPSLWRPPAPSSTLQHPPVASADLSPVEGELQRKSVYYEEGSEGGRGQCSTCIALPKIFWT